MNSVVGRVISPPIELYEHDGEMLYVINVEVKNAFIFEIVMHKEVIPAELPEWGSFKGNVISFKHEGKLQTFFNATIVEESEPEVSSTDMQFTGEVESVGKGLVVDANTGIEHHVFILKIEDEWGTDSRLHVRARGKLARQSSNLKRGDKVEVSGMFYRRRNTYDLSLTHMWKGEGESNA